VAISVLQHLRDPLAALQEMARIVKLGGFVSVIEGASTMPPGVQEIYALPSAGFPNGERLDAPLDRIDQKWVQHVYPKVVAELDLACGASSRALCYPRMFADAGLDDLEVNVVACVFSLADSRLNRAEAKRYIEAYFQYLEGLVTTEAAALQELHAAAPILAMDEVRECVQLLREKSRYLRENLSEIAPTLGWTGSTFLIFTGCRRNIN